MTTQAATPASRACIGMSCSITLFMSVAAGAQVQLHELPISLPSGCSNRGSLMSADGATVVGKLDTGAAGLWRLGTGAIEMGAFCPTGVNEFGSRACGIGSDGIAVVYDGEVRQVTSPSGQEFAAYGIVGSVVVGSLGGRAAYSDAAGIQLVSGIPEDEHPSFVSSAATWKNWGAMAGTLQGWSGKLGFVNLRGLFPTTTLILRGPDGSQSWINDLDRYGIRAVGSVPFFAGPGPWVASIPNRACVWSFGPGWEFRPTLLRQLPATDRSDARGASLYADVIVGTCTSSALGYRATAWAGGDRPIDLNRYLNCAGIDAPVLQIAIGVSDDGTRILAHSGTRLYLITGFTPPPGPITDLNWDGNTDGVDLGLLLSAWGPCSSPCDSDLNRDGAVDGNDLAQLLAKWGSCP